MMNGPGFVFTSGRDEKKAPYNIQKKETAYNMKIIFSPPNSTHAKHCQKGVYFASLQE